MTERRFSTLVVGGTGAVGQMVCRLLAHEGALVAFTYHQGEAAASQLSREIPESLAIRADLRAVMPVEEAVRETASAFGGLDALVHCAAICLSPGDRVPVEDVQHMDDIHERGWDELMAVNVKSAFFACRCAAPFLKQRGGGNFVLMSSINAVKLTPSPVHYAASKSALVGMAHTMAKELGKDNIRVNVLAPGVLENGVSRSLPKWMREDYLKHCGLKRAGRPGEIAAVAVWLARHNTYINGQTILIDGAV